MSDRLTRVNPSANSEPIKENVNGHNVTNRFTCAKLKREKEKRLFLVIVVFLVISILVSIRARMAIPMKAQGCKEVFFAYYG